MRHMWRKERTKHFFVAAVYGDCECRTLPSADIMNTIISDEHKKDSLDYQYLFCLLKQGLYMDQQHLGALSTKISFTFKVNVSGKEKKQEGILLTPST